MKLFGYTIEREANHPAPPPSEPVVGRNDGLSELLALTGEASMPLKLAAVYHCMALISQSIAQMPIRFMRLNAQGVFADYVKNDPDRLFYLLNVRPNEWMTAQQFKQQLVIDYLNGNAYILPADQNGHAIASGTGAVSQLILLNPKMVQRQQTTYPRYTVEDVDQGVPRQTVLGDQIIHIRNMNGQTHGMMGQSVLHYALSSIQQGSATNAVITERMRNGGLGKLLLRYRQAAQAMGTYKGKQMDLKASDIADKVVNNLVTAVDTDNLEVVPLAMNNSDLRLLETAHLSKADIALFFHVPLYYLGEQTSNYKTPQESRSMLINDCLAPICAQIEAGLLAWYTDDSNWWRYKFDFDEDARLALDAQAKATYYESLLRSGQRTVNELRAMDYMPPVEGGDELVISANLRKASELGNNQSANQAPADPAAEPQN